jgi:hypothetical protein
MPRATGCGVEWRWQGTLGVVQKPLHIWDNADADGPWEHPDSEGGTGGGGSGGDYSLGATMAELWLKLLTKAPQNYTRRTGR